MARVLFADDEPDILDLVAIRLRKSGHQVITVTCGEEALQAVEQSGPPDIAVLDVSMPGMNGLELLQALRARDGLEQLPVIFLSASVQPEDVQAGRSLGATYLTKPFVSSALLNAINRALPPKPTW